MFEVVKGKNTPGFAAVPNSLGNKGRRERGDGCFIGVRLYKAPLDNSGKGIGGVGKG